MSEYEIYAIHYATNQERRATENFLGGDPHDVAMPMDFYVWALVSPERTIMVDTGFDSVSGARRGRGVSRPVAEGLKQIGLDPFAVKDVVLTHMHWDHAGNHDLFPNARYHIQCSEMEYCTGPCMCHEPMRRPFDVQDVTKMVERVFAGRASFHQPASDLYPGISLHWVGGHSKGLQVVRVRTRRGWVVLASDASHYYANFRDNRPFPLVHNVENMLEGYVTLGKLADSQNHIIPGHDPRVLDLYPMARKGVERIVRLDAEPVSGL